ncbi:uncharacterized protein LOC104883580 [Beta vulgaris subsp. vulgaris]|uniref:uncharacterized protein LOC104883580 n=1 Tax=Beta vulgaris subsp. vulgaris TaxID=3555 RepID=UPI00254948D9|nr:uncharacterized protein LOC104883580 [Beta vulgaris subsp. vulgaris]
MGYVTEVVMLGLSEVNEVVLVVLEVNEVVLVVLEVNEVVVVYKLRVVNEVLVVYKLWVVNEVVYELWMENEVVYVVWWVKLNPTPSFHQDISQNFNESQSYHTSVQDSYADNNSTQPYFGVVGGQGSSNEVLREEDDDVEETHPTTIEPILTPPVVVRSKKKKTPNATTKAAAANMSWSVREEEAVISCYMEHCTDATIGTNQTGAELWRKVFASYELARQSRPHELPERTPNSIRSRWSRMAKDVLKWVGYLEEVARVKKSGQVDDDVRREAHIMWRRHENCNFIYEKAFESLFLYPKWKTRIRRYLPKSLRDEETNITQESDPDSSGSGKRVRLDEDDEVAVDDDSTGGRAFMSGVLFDRWGETS